MAIPDAKHSVLPGRMVDALKSPRARRFGLWVGAFVVFFGLFGYFAAPPLLKSILVDRLSAELQREVVVERIDVSPYTLSVRVGGVSVKADDGHEVFGFDELLLNVSSASVVKAGIVLDGIRLQRPRLAVTRLGEGRYDVSDLLDKWLKPSEPSAPPRFSLNNIQLLDGTVRFEDRPVGKQHVVSDINFSLPFISSLPYQADIVVHPRFSATVAGAPVVLEGRSKPFAETRESELSLDVAGFDLAGLQAYLPESLPFRMQRATVASELKLFFRESPDKVFSLSLAGGIHLVNLALTDAAGQSLIGWKRLDIDLADADLVNRRFAVRSVALVGPEIDAAVNRSGELNWLQLAEQLGGQRAAPEGEPAASPTPDWRVDAFHLAGGVFRWRDESNVKPIRGELRDIELTTGKVDGRLAEPLELTELSFLADFAERLRIEDMRLRGVHLDLAAHRVEIGEIGNKSARIGMLRKKDGALDWIAPPALKLSKRPEKAAGPPWTVAIGKLALNEVLLRLEDQTTAPAAVQVLDGLRLQGEGLSTEPGKAGRFSLATRVNQKGGLTLGGSLQLSPPAARLQVETQSLPLLPLQPYFAQFLNIALTRGVLSSKGELTAAHGAAGLNARYQGAVTLGDLLTVDKVNNADFLKWKSLYIGGIDFQWQPMALTVGELALTDFYSRLIVSPTGQLNLMDIVKKPATAGDGDVVAGPKVAGEKPGMPVTIAKVTLQGGTVNFSDFFVQPNYSANLTRVGGRLTGLSSAAGTTADMELRGRYANTAPVNVRARLNPLASKSYLDLAGEVSGVDLVPLSPYSGKYAGYNIKKGKLSLNVAYKLENGRLAAENRLFIDQLTFGDKVESPDATKLPVNLAISLLKNRRGEIDLNLPISGSLDDPQFSVGGLIFKVIANLFVKAVTSPFALLGSMFGGGEELSTIDFAPGRAGFDAAAGKRLEALARALNEREALKLEITGRADPDADKEGLKWTAIQRAVRVEKQKEMIRKGKESASADTLEVSDAEYPVLLQRAYREAKFPKPRNIVGLPKELPVEEMEQLMLTHLPATPDDVRQLAMRRAERVQAWLVEQGKVAPERVFLLPPKVEPVDKGRASRVDFSLR